MFLAYTTEQLNLGLSVIHINWNHSIDVSLSGGSLRGEVAVATGRELHWQSVLFIFGP